MSLCAAEKNSASYHAEISIEGLLYLHLRKTIFLSTSLHCLINTAMSDVNKNTGYSHIETIAVHEGYDGDNKTGAVVQPIYLSTTFERDKNGVYGPFNYTRANNPNRETLETKLAAIEGGDIAIAFSSGLAAINAIFHSVLQVGDHLIIPDDCYHGTVSVIEKIFQRWSIEYTEVDMDNEENIEAAIRQNTKLLWLETPSNPRLKIADIRLIASKAKARKILIGCDNTFATPLLQKPLDLGADFVMHSSTKFLCGHSDVLGGVVIVNNDNPYTQNIRDHQAIAGGVPSPFDCWLLSRSLATFPLRMSTSCSNALAIAAYLEKHPAIEKVLYPGLASHPNHLVAVKQMDKGFGGVLTVLVRGGKKETMGFASRLKILKHATSLGGVETLIEHRRSAEGEHPRSPENLLRISAGIEHIDDLIADLEQALPG